VDKSYRRESAATGTSRINCSSVHAQEYFLVSPMATPPPRRRIKFSDLALGQRFYDPISAEYFVKQSESLAAMVSGAGDGRVSDEFEAADIVGIDLN
jgi:hypothetical protein